MKLVLAISLSTGLLTACSEYSGELPSDTAAFGSFRELPGRIGVSIRSSASNVWDFEIRQGKISRASNLPSAARNATSVGVGVEKPSGIPERGELAPRGPFALSGDKMYLAAAMDLKPPKDSAPQHLVVVQTQTSEIVYQSGKVGGYIESVAWSPDSKYVVILKRELTKHIGSPIDLLSSMFGHAVQYSNYWVEVIDVNGKPLARAQVASDVKGSWGEVVWMSRGSPEHTQARYERYRYDGVALGPAGTVREHRSG
jgi:microcompartment protein CcmK/EutM